MGPSRTRYAGARALSGCSHSVLSSAPQLRGRHAGARQRRGGVPCCGYEEAQAQSKRCDRRRCQRADRTRSQTTRQTTSSWVALTWKMRRRRRSTVTRRLRRKLERDRCSRMCDKCRRCSSGTDGSWAPGRPTGRTPLPSGRSHVVSSCGWQNFSPRVHRDASSSRRSTARSTIFGTCDDGSTVWDTACAGCAMTWANVAATPTPWCRRFALSPCELCRAASWRRARGGWSIKTRSRCSASPWWGCTACTSHDRRATGARGSTLEYSSTQPAIG